MLNTKEHEDLIAQFDRENGHRRLDKESRELWRGGNVYQDGHVNDSFLSYRKGYALGKCVGREEAA